MTTFDLRIHPATLEEMLTVASSEAVRIVTSSGREFVLEDAHAFEHEATTLGKSQQFMKFLSERAVETGRRSLAEIEAELGD